MLMTRVSGHFVIVIKVVIYVIECNPGYIWSFAVLKFSMLLIHDMSSSNLKCKIHWSSLPGCLVRIGVQLALQSVLTLLRDSNRCQDLQDTDVAPISETLAQKTVHVVIVTTCLHHLEGLCQPWQCKFTCQIQDHNYNKITTALFSGFWGDKCIHKISVPILFHEI